ncbi:aminopeptidase P family protein [Croceicoccus sp. F390]|uniref:Aminopeptidase P family protein n=1 Tax=Croceicoccus esteveae TaxID=3075597 RepID=A0ABU2ZKZ3_9SPHN|nr:aminopeptidase P family protein [Croceicoccus sp. F390]MDT0576723.1 aminopeptidase P family protein [Croceicoccus sp. F390]
MLMQTHEARLSALREELKRCDLDGFVVPISDEHMSEYVGDYAQRLAWLTGFAGSAGSAIVLQNKATMFVDGRYTLQVRDQVDGRLWDYESVPATDHARWLAKNAGKGARIGFDPWLHTRSWADKVGTALAEAGAELVAVDSNPLDAVWQDRPQPSAAKAETYDNSLSGQASADKREAFARALKENRCEAGVVAALDSIAWLLNIRGSDVAHTPVALSYAIVRDDGTAQLFIAPAKVSGDLRDHLGNQVTLRDRDEFEAGLAELGGKRVAVDPDSGVAAIFAALEEAGATPVALADPVMLPKALKNPAEVQGHRDAQARDTQAVSRFLRWLDEEAPKGSIDELSAAARLYEERAASGDLKDMSFETISGAGPNGASPHYRVTQETNRRLEPNSVYLVDSGGQYPGGTTDITRTIWIGPDAPPALVKDRFTRVLKGHIAIDTALFPQGTSGAQLDSFARQFLWQAGLDYAHGTGHGVGSYLGVHEGPQRIAKPRGGQAGTDQELHAGMILSNEPGYYKAGEYGIRIENLVLTVKREIAGAELDMLGFDTLTFVPIDRKLVDTALLSAQEREWFNSYHARTLAIARQKLDGADLAWVELQCARV